uniref:Uncharacterized protein n=1 Tax=Candidatus Kentrum sp. LPFa TaxID=2126335 RepID=A0A450X3W2_9GAMM|nr:MAG: hypothetical protein BECKLPF1236A_GA0070988_104003 [Candidatus Kentron sp. LPFa]VFK35692.1 MAG: hypothetical protein BECKLPF1236C_GA0070990_104093 [Candidatus Kentron sp. LPFa]
MNDYINSHMIDGCNYNNKVTIKYNLSGFGRFLFFDGNEKGASIPRIEGSSRGPKLSARIFRSRRVSNRQVIQPSIKVLPNLIDTLFFGRGKKNDIRPTA